MLKELTYFIHANYVCFNIMNTTPFLGIREDRNEAGATQSATNDSNKTAGTVL